MRKQKSLTYKSIHNLTVALNIVVRFIPFDLIILEMCLEIWTEFIAYSLQRNTPV